MNYLRKVFSMLLIIGLCASCMSNTAKANSSADAVLVIASEKVAESEYYDIAEALTNRGVSFLTAGTTMNPSTTYSSVTIEPDMLIQDISEGNFLAIILVGGEGAAHELAYEEDLIDLLRSAGQSDTIISAICAAPVCLAEADLLKDIPATVYPNPPFVERLEESGAQIVSDQMVVVSDNVSQGIAPQIITGRDPDSAAAFGETLAGIIADRKLY